MNCPNCNSEVSAEAKFCHECGASLRNACPSCGSLLRPGAKFCSHCGFRLPVPATAGEAPAPPAPAPVIGLPPDSFERRQVTILFTDVIGYSTLSESRDPEEVMEIMRGAYPCLMDPVQRHGGTIVQVMGDGLLAFFGAPLAHEDDQENAIRAGLEIQRCVQNYAASLQAQGSLPGFNVRVGIHTGLVVVGEMIQEKGFEYSALGDAVNLAARLQQNAPPGGVLVSHETYRHVLGLFNAQVQEPLKVKGRQQIVQTYLVTSIKPLAWRIRTHGVAGVETRMIGRDVELLFLQNTYHDSLIGGEVAFCMLTGDPGVGKSRLLDEFAAWVDLQPEALWYFRGRAIPAMQAAPYSVFRDLFSHRFEILESDSAAQALDKFRRGAAEFLEENQADLVGQLVGFDFSASQAVQRLQDSPSFSQLASLYLSNYFRSLSKKPLLILLEDLHVADDSSLDLLTQLVGEIERDGGYRFMLACAGRNLLFERRPNWGEGVPGYRRLELRPLSRRNSRQLVEEILKKAQPVPPQLAERIVDETEGNPLFIEELIKMLIEDGIIQAEGEIWTFLLDRLTSLRVPPTLAGILQARLDGLPAAERAALQRASVIGRVFWDSLVSALTEDKKEATQVGERLAMLHDRELIYHRERSTIAGTVEYVFKHNLLQEATYETVLLKQRRRYHAQVAAWIEANAGERLDEYLGLIADNYAQGDRPLEAADWYKRAGQRAINQGAPREARRLLEKALELLPEFDLRRRWEALLCHDQAVGLLGERKARRDDDDVLLGLAEQMGDDACLAEAFFRAGTQAHHEGDHSRAQGAFDRAIKHARKAQNKELEAVALSLKIFDLVRQGALEAAAPLVEPAMEIAGKAENPQTYAMALQNLSLYYAAIGDLGCSAELTQRVIAANQEQGNFLGEAIGLGNLGFYYLSLGQYEKGRATLQRALELAARLEARKIHAYTLLNLGLAFWRLEQPQAALEHLQQSQGELEIIGDRMGLASLLFYRGLAHEQAGDLSQAQASFESAQAAFVRLGAPPLAADAQAGLARARLHAGVLEQAQEAAEGACAFLDENGPNGLELPILAFLSCADVFQALGDQAHQERCLETARAELQARAARLSEEAWRQSFLDAVPEHIRLLREVSGS